MPAGITVISVSGDASAGEEETAPKAPSCL